MGLITQGIGTILVLPTQVPVLPFHTDYAAISHNVIGVVYAPVSRLEVIKLVWDDKCYCIILNTVKMLQILQAEMVFIVILVW